MGPIASSGPAPGLSSVVAEQRLARFGPNLPPRPHPRRLVRRVVDQLRDPMILMLLAAFAAVVWLGDLSDASVIVAVVLVNTTLGVTQEVRAERAVAALAGLSAPVARARRDGAWVRVRAEVLVPGDEVMLQVGDVVPADGRLDEALVLEVDESAMTGESVPVERGTGDELSAGTVVTRGRGLMTVLRTGASSGLGRIAALMAATPVRPTPLQRRLSSLSRTLVAVTLLVAALVAALGVLRGEPVTRMLVLGVSLAVAAIPESLPAVVSVALALGAHRMAVRSAVVRWLPAVETLGSVDVLASDKTGTLTEGRMVVQRLWTPPGRSPGSGALDRLLRDVVLCNDAEAEAGGNGAGVVGGASLEEALLVEAARHGMEPGAVRVSWPRCGEEPFDSRRRSMTTQHRSPGGAPLTVCKGAPETVLDLVPAGDEQASARAEARALAAQGLRVLAVADLEGSGGAGERGLRLAGLVAVADPPREVAPRLVRDCRRAGIRVVLVTGDHEATARWVAGRVGLGTAHDQVVDGEAVARGEHRSHADTIDVYARTRPEQKVDVLGALQSAGHVVAMTGDGVNDAPALRRADVGVAMGRRGTEVARQAADLVLADDDLATIVTAVAEGRRIYANIRTFLRYALSGGVAEVLVLLLGPAAGLAAPVAAGQILWINMLTHGLPGVAFGGEPLDPSVMHRPSPSPRRSTLGDGLWWRVLVTGSVIAVAALVAGAWARGHGDPVQPAVFTTLGLAQLGVALALRAPRRGAEPTARSLEAAVTLSAVLQVLPLVWSPAAGLLHLDPLPARSLVPSLLLAAVPGGGVALLRRRGRGRPGSTGAGPLVPTDGTVAPSPRPGA